MGIIYIIKDNETEDTYVGSTTMRLHQRINDHKSSCKRRDEGNKNVSNCSSYPIIRRGNYKAEVLQTLETNDKVELRKVETDWIRKLNPINTMKKSYASVEEKKASRLEHAQTSEFKEKKKISDAKYRNGEHREDLLQRKREYGQERKVEIAVKTKEYREKNKELIKEKKAQEYLKAKADGDCDQIKCPCGGTYSKHNQSRHFRTKKHMAFTGI